MEQGPALRSGRPRGRRQKGEPGRGGVEGEGVGIDGGSASTLLGSLGVPFGPDFAACIAAAFGTQPPRMHSATDRWLDLDPCLFGRVHAANQCLASKVVYQQAFLPPQWRGS